MKNGRGLITSLTAIISIISIYYLSLTWLNINIDNNATKHATDELGNIDYAKKQEYIESIKKDNISFLGLQYTYDQVQKSSIKLGLDLKGGMHVVVEVSYPELIKGIANTESDELEALIQQTSQEYNTNKKDNFVKTFYKVYNKSSKTKSLNQLFINRELGENASDHDIINFLERQVESSIERSFNIIRTRLDRFGTSQITMQYLPMTGKIQIEFPGITNPEQVRKLLQSVAKLSFFEVYDIKEVLYNNFKSVNEFLIKESSTTNENQIKESQIYSLLQGDYGLAYLKSDKNTIDNILNRPEVKALLPKNIQFCWGSKPIIKDNLEILTLTPLKNNKPLIGGDIITQARQVFDEQGRPSVSMQMNNLGTKMWKKITANNIGKQIAIVLDDKVVSAPVVNTEIPNGISQISGNFTVEEAKDLANILKSGSMPAPVKIVEEAIIGATLSKEAQLTGILSMIIGLVIIMIFMTVYYAKAGVIANITLLFNMLFIFGIMSQLNSSLTMAGIAGIVLTIGMSIDANVLIFERIREEIRNNTTLKNAISIGYKKTYSSILDSNITTFLTGLILYLFGQGPIKGFATTLMIGILSSLFSSVLISRVIISNLINRKKHYHLTFGFKYSQNYFKQININFLKKRFIYYTISIVLIITGISCLISKGINLGIDFSGGNSYIIKFHKPIDISHLKTEINNSFKGNSTEVRTYGSSNTVKIITSYMSKSNYEGVLDELTNKVTDAITKSTGFTYIENVKDKNTIKENTFSILQTSKVEPSIANDIKKSAQKSIMLSLAMIFLYILVRFRSWQFGISSTIALVHDTLMIFASLGISSLLGYNYEIDEVFIASLLTVIGYSINDTVVIFDRIRENISKTPREIVNKNIHSIMNKSINETLSRTIITSLTTIAAVLILFIFGGAALRGFSFSLLMGIVFGTYSSIFIATPLASDLYKTKK